MDHEEPHASNQSTAKSQKQNDDCDQSGVVDADAVDVAANAQNVQQTADIFKLDIDCFDETFEYLPLKDLISVGKTCKRLQQVASYCYQQNYSGGAFCRDSLAPFIQNMSIYGEGLQFFQNVQSKFHRLKEVEIRERAVIETDVNRLKDTLGKLEALRLTSCNLNGNDQHIIDLCPKKIKRLTIDQCQGCEFEWLNQKYPTLEYFQWYPYHTESIDGILMFLERNSNIRKFASDSNLIWNNRDVLMTTANIKLDELAIWMIPMEIVKLVPFCRFLNELHERGFYKRLQLYSEKEMNQEQVDQLATVNALVKLSIQGYSYNPIALSALKSPEEFRVWMMTDLEMVAKDCINLKRIHFKYASIDDIMPLIKRSVKLQKIKIEELYYDFDGIYYSHDTNIINLRAFNKEREQLPDAEKITLYVSEKIYLATKWAMKETDFGLIRLKRQESIEWEHDF